MFCVSISIRCLLDFVSFCFLSFSSVLIAILAKIDIIHDTDNFSTETFSAALQNFIVCVEMSVAALAHHFAFSYKDFHDVSRPQIDAPLYRTLLDAIDVSDVYVHDVARMRKKVIKRKVTNYEQMRGNQDLAQPMLENTTSPEPSNSAEVEETVKKSTVTNTRQRQYGNERG